MSKTLGRNHLHYYVHYPGVLSLWWTSWPPSRLGNYLDNYTAGHLISGNNHWVTSWHKLQEEEGVGLSHVVGLDWFRGDSSPCLCWASCRYYQRTLPPVSWCLHNYGSIFRDQRGAAGDLVAWFRFVLDGFTTRARVRFRRGISKPPLLTS